MALTKVSYSLIDGAPLNVKDFGAVADGVTDNTLALQAALNAALATGNPIEFNNGTYNHTGLVYEGGNLKLIGKNTTLNYTGANDGFLIRTPVNQNASNFSASGITFTNGRSSLKIIGQGSGVFKKIIVSDCIFTTTSADTTSLWFERCSETIVSNNRVYNAFDVGIYYAFSDNALISNNILANCAGSAAISVGYSYTDIKSSNIIIEGNEIYNDVGSSTSRIYNGGIVYVLGSDVLITNNHISNRPDALQKIQCGIYCEQYTIVNATIAGNKIYNMAEDGIRIGPSVLTQGQNVQIINNSIVKCSLQGIRIVRAASVLIQDNYIDQINQNGIIIDNLSCDIKIVNNVFSNVAIQNVFAALYAINSFASRTTICGNVFIDSQLGGVLSSSVTTPTYSVDASGTVTLYSSGVAQATIVTTGLTWGQLKTAIDAVPGWSYSLVTGCENIPIEFMRRTGFRQSDNVQQYTVINAISYLGTPEPFSYVLLGASAARSSVLNNTVHTNTMDLPNHHNNTEMFTFLADTVKDVNSYGGGRTLNYAAAPVAANGYFILGDVVYNSAPAAGQPIGWMCTVSGRPGTWRPFANL